MGIKLYLVKEREKRERERERERGGFIKEVANCTLNNDK